MIPAVKFRGRLQAIKFDRGKFTKEMDKAAQTLVREAAREWLRAIVLIIPVWTGFAKGSIKFAEGPKGVLSRFLNVTIPIVPRSEIPIWYTHSDGRKIRKLPEKAGPLGRYNFTTSNHVYRFSFRSDVVHFLINEFHSSVSPISPWESMLAGRFAFNQYIKANLHRLPKVSSALIRTEIPVGGRT